MMVSCAIAAFVLTTWLSGSVIGVILSAWMFSAEISILGFVFAIFAVFIFILGFLYVVVNVDSYDITDSNMANKIVDYCFN